MGWAARKGDGSAAFALFAGHSEVGRDWPFSGLIDGFGQAAGVFTGQHDTFDERVSGRALP